MKNVIDFPDLNTIKDEASLWIVKFERDEEPSRDDIDALHEWVQRSPTHREVLLKFASSWNDMDLLSELISPVEDTGQSKMRWFDRIMITCAASLIATKNRLYTLIESLMNRALAAPAVLMLSISIGISAWVFIDYNKTTDNIYLTSLGEQSTQVLPDGSTLWLNTNSKVEIVFDSERRRINLYKGEAHFKVFPNSEKPFEVYVGNRLVRAVGTAFSVYRHNNGIKVTVSEGKVDLAAFTPELIKESNNTMAQGQSEMNDSLSGQNIAIAEPKNAMVLGSLKAGQSVVMPTNDKDTLEEVVTVEQQELVRRLSWLQGKLVFAGETLDEVVEEVSRYTPLRIEVIDPELKDMRIGGQFQVGETSALFDVLESGFGVTVSYLNEQHVQLSVSK